MNLSSLLPEKRNSKLYLLPSVLSGVLLWLAWPPFNMPWLIFIGFVPLFWIVFSLQNSEGRSGKFAFFGYIYLGLLVWNGLTTYWIYNASVPGAFFAVFANAFLMSLPFLLLYFSINNMGRRLSFIAFIFYWISLEYLHLNWDLAWPWLNLGNVFSKFPGWVQWYEYTGALGGTFWILSINIIITQLLVRIEQARRNAPNWYGYLTGVSFTIIGLIIFLLLPFVFSWILGNRVPEPTKHVTVSVVQPNVDPYSEKFDPAMQRLHADNLLELSQKGVDAGAEIIVWPETALPENVRLESLHRYEVIKRITAFLKENPQVRLLIGATTFKSYNTEEEKTPTARKSASGDSWYDVFNSALYVDTSMNWQVYHKSKLVPGVEIMPYPQYFRFLESLALDLGGASGSLGRQDKPSLLISAENLKMAPIICYESIFGEYVSRFVKKGADILVIITNDGWWGDTEGYFQHFHYASLRSIETRRSIARSANTGISGFFDVKGNVLQASGYWEPDMLTAKLPVYEEITFYTRYGDYIGRVSVGTMILLVLIAFMRNKLKK